MTAPLLAIENLSVAGGGRPLLRGVDLRVEAGTRVAITGPSGLGKTSFLRAVAGLDDVPQGSVRLRGADGDALRWPEFRRRVMLVPQQSSLGDGTVLSHLARPFAFATAGGRPFPEGEALALLESLGLPPALADQDGGSLSAGEAQRVVLARALLAGPEVLLLDEPTAALDPASVERVEALLLRWCAAAPRAFLAVTHDREQGRRLCTTTLDLSPFAATVGGPS